mmetsp:Transcript_19458/g.48780  ORF Transcript_19458/g.48780 Transcript_19458/m.48780 type:complete len:242 (+) Transcript_19458:57-782(+)|eukprot:CAMPEP_0173435392 /NCGR_PEP_ID=MMETSP1357-20121228/14997_1 /TAXON_ID=77926 /ORGANISM="Hemiselmis rufescens, Strain PCC563" /LENGTH=241 /DNA_ID=CAMNT_0014400367 /DNA_START=42 /DNA_END=767 /DNA_ORIENTATION=-
MWGVGGNQGPQGAAGAGQGPPQMQPGMQPSMLPQGMQGLPPGMQGMQYAMPPHYMMPGFGMPHLPHHFQQSMMGMPEVAQATAGGKIRRKRRKQEKGGPKKPATAFVLFSNEQRESVKTDNPGISFTDIGRKLGEMWREMEANMKKRYELRATAAKDEYMAEKKIWLENKEKDPKQIEREAAEAAGAASSAASLPTAAAPEPAAAAEAKDADSKDGDAAKDGEGGAEEDAGKGDGAAAADE